MNHGTSNIEMATAAVEAVVEEQANTPAVEAAPAPEAPKKKRSKKKLAAAPAPVIETEAPAVEDHLTEGVITAPEVPASIEEAAPAPQPEITYEPYKLFDIVPDGGPGSDVKEALPVAVSPENVPTLLNEVARMILAVTGPRDGLCSDVNPKQFHAGVRVYRPQSKFPGKVTTMDEVMYAARVGHRILNAVNKVTKAVNEGKRFPLDGGYGKHTDADTRALAVWETTKKLSTALNVELHLPQFVAAAQ